MFLNLALKNWMRTRRCFFLSSFVRGVPGKKFATKVYEPLTACYSDEDLRVLDEAVPERMSLGSEKDITTLIILKARKLF